MQKLLSELVQAPPFMYGILIGMTIIVFILTHLTTRYDKKYPYDANHYTLPVLYLIIFTMGFAMATGLQSAYVDAHAQDFATVKKVNNTLVVKGQSIFLQDKTLPIKKQVDNMNIIEYKGEDYIVYDDQIK